MFWVPKCLGTNRAKGEFALSGVCLRGKGG